MMIFLLLIKELIRTNTGKSYRIIFKGTSTSVPLLSDTAKNFPVDHKCILWNGYRTTRNSIWKFISEYKGESKEIDMPFNL